jgi:hypothetical protein
VASTGAARRWLSFSNSDQRILREETQGLLWDALVVPGTLATYYKQGVGGYVLARRKPFVIDPRTPLIQPSPLTPRPVPKASHETLAGIHNPEVGAIWAGGEEVQMEVWSDARWSETVTNVLAFQTSFEFEAAEKIDKYEAMLRDAGMSLDAPVHGPEWLIPPYWAVRDERERWWDLSVRGIQQAIDEYGASRIMPVVCLASGSTTEAFSRLLQTLPEGLDRVFCWRGSWDESTATAPDINGWLNAVDLAAMRGIEVTNMYGGALSVLLTGFGLRGVNHGVGYSESRDEQRLSQTGGPRMRYYVPRLRGFESVPRAQQFLDSLSTVDGSWRCECAVCGGRETIVDLTTEELKLHFLLCRGAEFASAEDDIGSAVADLRHDGEQLVDRFGGGQEDETRHPLARRGDVLLRWADALAPRLPRL